MAIRLQFSTAAHSWQSALIRKLSHSPFSHVDCMLPDGSLLGASDQGEHSKVIEGNPCGVAIRPPDYQEFGVRRIAVLDVDQTITDAYYVALRSQLGKSFDPDALWSFLDDHPFDRDWRDPLKWFCSELQTWGLETGGIWGDTRLIWPKSRISPTDLLMMLMTNSFWINRDTFWQQPQRPWA